MANRITTPTDKQLYWRSYHREYRRKRRADPRYRLEQQLKQHGFTLEEHDAKMRSQNGMCAFCGGPPGDRGFVIDHDHKTGKFRGLIHFRCNILLGYVRDNPETIARAVRYLRASNVG